MNPADKVEKWKISKLIPYARNARTHSDEQVAQIAASIREWGWTTPVLVDEQGGIIAGHGRTLAAQRLKMTEVPVMVAKGWSEAKRRAYVIADNKLALNAGWDNELLALELAEIGELGFDLDLTGFTPDEISALDVDGLLESKDDASAGDAPKGNLSDRFMIPPFTVMNAREGWWQDRKRAWLAIGIKSELGRGGGGHEGNAATQRVDNQERGRVAKLRSSALDAAPGGSARPACDYSNKQRGNGAGRPING